jgi:hypothetical protein
MAARAQLLEELDAFLGQHDMPSLATFPLFGTDDVQLAMLEISDLESTKLAIAAACQQCSVDEIAEAGISVGCVEQALAFLDREKSHTSAARIP